MSSAGIIGLVACRAVLLAIFEGLAFIVLEWLREVWRELSLIPMASISSRVVVQRSGRFFASGRSIVACRASFTVSVAAPRRTLDELLGMLAHRGIMIGGLNVGVLRGI
jgi:hypothetical protein